MRLSYCDVLTFEELAKHLVQYGYEYNVDNDDDCNNLRKTILNLCGDYMLRATFYYSGIAKVSRYKFKKGDDYKYLSTSKEKVSGDFFLDYDNLVKLLKVNEPIHLDGQVFDIYTAIGIDSLPVLHNHREQAKEKNGSFFSIRIGGEINSPVIKIGDLHYLKTDIDQAVKLGLFNNNENKKQADEPIQQLTIEAKSKIDKLERQLAHANTELAALKQSNSEAVNYLYTTPAIEIMNEVIAEFWIDYDPNNPAPKQSTITQWITDNFDGVSDALALNIDKVCRHSDAKSGGRYKR